MASKSISKSVVWQLAGKFALQGISFFTAPIFTRLLTPADYGYTALYASWVAIFSLIVGLQTYGSIGNARIKYDAQEINSYLSSIMTISVIAFFVVFTIGFIFRNVLSNLLGITSNLVCLCIIQSFCAYAISFYVSKLDQFKQVEKSTLVSLSQSLLVVGISLVAVINAKSDKAIVRIYSQSIPPVLFGCIFLFLIYKKGKVFWNSAYNKFCFALTFPLLIHGLGGLIFSQSDRIMLTKMHSQESLGIYSVSYSLCSILTVIFGALNVSWLPFYMDFKKQDNKQEILLHTRRYIKLYTIISSGFILLAYDVFKFMAPEKYWSGMHIIPILVFAFYFDFLYLFPVNFEFFYCKTKLIPVATLLSAVINIVVNYFFIPRFGIMGAASGTLIAHFFTFFFHYVVARFLMKEKFEFRWQFFTFGSVTMLGALVFVHFIQPYLVIRWIFAIILAAYTFFDIIKNKSII